MLGIATQLGELWSTTRTAEDNKWPSEAHDTDQTGKSFKSLVMVGGLCYAKNNTLGSPA